MARIVPVMDHQFPPDADSELFHVSNTDSDVLHQIDTFIHRAEIQAYASVLRAFVYKTNNLNQEKQKLIIGLIKELEISNDEHIEVLDELKNDEMIHLVRDWKSFDNYSPSSTASASQQHPSLEPAKAASLDPLIGKKVSIKWPEPDKQYFDADITDYDPAEDKYKVVYDANTPNEFCEWIDLKELLPEDVQWEGNDHTCTPCSDDQNGQDCESNNTTEEKDQQAQVRAISSLPDTSDGNSEKVKMHINKSTMCTQTLMRPAKPKSKSKAELQENA